MRWGSGRGCRVARRRSRLGRSADAVKQTGVAGRFCPADYHLEKTGFSAVPDKSVDVLYVVGGLYGNADALAEIERMFAQDARANATARCELVFNGDFHWFDAHPAAFTQVHQRTARYTRLRGNVETELARDDDASAGCGCAYPESVPDSAVAWSNQIIALLAGAGRAAIGPDAMHKLSRLPAVGTWQVGGKRIAVTHGDHVSLAGWSFADDRLEQTWQQGLAAQMIDWGVDVFASSHTCLPVADTFESNGRKLAVINNGSAGLANVRRCPDGIITRIARVDACNPPVQPLYSTRIGECIVSALPVSFDLPSWRQRFETLWPERSAARLAYFDRIIDGPDYTLDQAARGGFDRLATA